MPAGNALSPWDLGALTGVTFLVSVIATYLSIVLAHRFALHAIPDERSSHEVPTPRIGGIGAAAPVFIFLVYWTFQYPPEDGAVPLRSHALVLLFGGAALFAVGLLDDLITLSAGAKLGGQVLAGLTTLGFLQPWLSAQEGDAWIHTVHGVGLGVLWPLWTVGFVNAFNFMDGMNGKAGVFAVIVLVFAALMLMIAPDGAGATMLGQPLDEMAGFALPVALASIGGVMGFLVFNCRPRAAIFLGDSGSHFFGYLIAAMAFLGATSILGPGGSLLAYTILLMPFLFDVTLTLIKRFREGKTVWTAHREHLYQRLMIAGLSHMRVLGICAATYLMCGALALAAAWSGSFPVLIVCVVSSLGVMAGYTAYVHRVERDRLESDSDSRNT